MKESLTSFDLRVLVGELASLREAHLNQVYQEGETFILKFRLPQEGRRELFVEPGHWLFLGDDFAKPPEPPPLAQRLRRALGNAVLKDVRQRGFDRILLLEFQKETSYTLVLEMFGRGNLVLLRGEEILAALRRERWRTREIRRGAAYRFPPDALDPTSLDEEGFRQALAAHPGEVVRVLASALGLGGLYAEEVCLRAEVEKHTPTEALDAGETKGLLGAVRALLQQLEGPAPRLVLDRGEAIDVVPFPLEVYAGYDAQAFEALSEALRRYVEALPEGEAEGPPTARIDRRIAQQEETLEDLREEAEVAGAAAEYLYAHYQELDHALRAAREGERPEGLDPTTGRMRLQAEGHPLELDPALDVDENARLLYERKKRALDRMGRVQRALEESRLARSRAEAGEEDVPQPPQSTYAPSRRFWVDAFRWGLTSEGRLILGGRDARSNERLVRKHLEPGDRYVHADLPGASSVILKDGAEAEERELREACRFALAFSRAWRAGIGAGSAYWVTPEQVTKTAESGEYVKTGSFVIRGRRNYHHNLPLALGVGLVEYEGATRVIPTDPDAIARLADRYVLLEPAGPLERAELVGRLAPAFRVPREEIERLLPAGTFRVAQVHGLRLEEDG